MLCEQLCTGGRYIVKEEYAVQNDGKLLFGVMDLKWGETMEHRAALGIRTSNNKQFAISLVAGARVFVCDNLIMAGEYKSALLDALTRSSVRAINCHKLALFTC